MSGREAGAGFEKCKWQLVSGGGGANVYAHVRRPDVLSCNSYLVEYPECWALIDPGALPEQTAALRGLMAEREGGEKKPVLVLATIQVATAIITEATLSFLGVGAPPTSPSLGTLIRIGNDYLFSGEWWITIFPGAMLVLIALSVNLLGDWLRDALNPRLR